ncbi:MAG: hypothetical protein R3272_00920 [Candidatus Promineifilaceae bacterium]|nr:hypothetical protein [Candidatus Promineifilaceae bacterium]
MDALQITYTLSAPGRRPAGLAWDGHYLWNADFGDGRLYRLDPESGAVAAGLLCPGILSGLAWDGESLWLGVLDKRWLLTINPRRLEVDRTLPVEEAGRVGGVAWDGNNLWVVDQQAGALLAVERESGRVVRRLVVPVAGGGLVYRDGALWLGAPQTMRFDQESGQFEWEGEQEDYALLKIDPADGVELARFPLDFFAAGLTWAGDSLWLSSARAGALYRGSLVRSW